ncbi:MAG: hypothetical protein Q8K38_03605 [Burkholderiaceae bacterium]|nr:hypothetical protein [Burkholderiaceae bacterium]MDZ4145371.1 hypothetical protein [Burkholderiales bacterium]
MRIRTFLLIAAILLVAGFVALNFDEFMRSTVLNFGVAEVRAPLGLVMLGALITVLAVFMMALMYFQTAHLLELRKVTREVAEQRALADKAEASRFTELQQFLQTRLDQVEQVQRELAAAAQDHARQLEANLTRNIEQTSNGLAASVGELDDRLARQQAASGGAA